MEQERFHEKRYSQGSIRSMSSDRLSIERMMEDFKSRVPRYNDILYVLSIESQSQSKKRRGWASIENKDNNSIRYSNNEETSMEVETQNLSRGSHDVFGKYEQRKQIYFPQEQGITHQCDCYRVCQGQQCSCLKTLLIQPCKQGKCCVLCIEQKNRKIFLASNQQSKIAQNQIFKSQIISKTYFPPPQIQQKVAIKKQNNSEIKLNKICKNSTKINSKLKNTELVFQGSYNSLINQIPNQLPMSIEFTDFQLPNFYNVQ